jgi:hypothetical protein
VTNKVLHGDGEPVAMTLGEGVAFRDAILGEWDRTGVAWIKNLYEFKSKPDLVVEMYTSSDDIYVFEFPKSLYDESQATERPD